jgi:hypothetical protein
MVPIKGTARKPHLAWERGRLARSRLMLAQHEDGTSRWLSDERNTSDTPLVSGLNRAHYNLWLLHDRFRPARNLINV